MYHKNRIQFDSNQISNEDHSSIFSVAEVPVNSIVTVTRCYSLSFSERNVPFPGEQSCFTCTCFTALDVHVSQSYMYMFYCFTCTCKITLHTEASYVTLQEGALSIPEKEMDSNGRQHLA